MLELEMPRASTKLPSGYPTMLEDIKSRIRAAQIRAALSVNRELIELYWDIGKLITIRQKKEGWGKSIVEELSRDIKKEFPDITGFSTQNLWYMRAFYKAWTEELSNLQQVVGEIPWGHNIQLLSKVKDPLARLWYARMTVEFGWSRSVLVHQIETELYRRQGKAITNFSKTLPAR